MAVSRDIGGGLASFGRFPPAAVVFGQFCANALNWTPAPNLDAESLTAKGPCASVADRSIPRYIRYSRRGFELALSTRNLTAVRFENTEAGT
jgi:hypothetical protein